MDLGLSVGDANALIDCVRQSLRAIAEATTQFDPKARALAIKEYDQSHFRARRAGVYRYNLRARCESAYLRCLAVALRAIAYAVVDGNEDRWEIIIDWYEDDRARMIAAGFREFSVDARASSRVWKGIR